MLSADETIYLVMDNHPAHRTLETRRLMNNLRIEPFYMSSNSPEFNSIETLWAGVKLRVNQKLNNFSKQSVKLTKPQFELFI